MDLLAHRQAEAALEAQQRVEHTLAIAPADQVRRTRRLPVRERGRGGIGGDADGMVNDADTALHDGGGIGGPRRRDDDGGARIFVRRGARRRGAARRGEMQAD